MTDWNHMLGYHPMTPENFAYWMKGFFELTPSNKLTEEQVQSIREHLDLVFNKITPTEVKKTYCAKPLVEEQPNIWIKEEVSEPPQCQDNNLPIPDNNLPNPEHPFFYQRIC